MTFRSPFLGLLLTGAPLIATAQDQSLAHYRPALDQPLIERLRRADPAKGEQIFQVKCSACHDSAKSGGHGKGPHLWNLLDRPAGRIAGFDFSPALQQASHSWSYANLDYYLTLTARAIPGVAMNFRGLRDDGDRAALIGFLRTCHDNPPPLP